MLNQAEVMIRYIVAISCYVLSGTATVTGNLAGLCGVLGTVELVTGIMRYSPLMELLDRYGPVLMKFHNYLATGTKSLWK
ncbi:MAG TPA: hypothetical protein GX404_03235 [Syntrophomonadaceae bacterium]|nr:hypothetical protein [Syntrophomonadaceae bacterium]